MEIRQIVEKWLRANNYDGLVTENCGCEVDDLMPCDNYRPDCTAGYKVPCPGGEDCPADGDCPWHISTSKEATNGKEQKKKVN